MTDPMAESSETWVKHKSLVADWEMWQVWVMHGEITVRCLADFMTETDADAIIADHEQARLASRHAEALAALEERIKDTNYHPQYTMGLAHAYGLLTDPPRIKAARGALSIPDTTEETA